MSTRTGQIGVNNTTWQSRVNNVQTKASSVRANVRYNLTRTTKKQLRQAVDLTATLNGLVNEYLSLVRQDVTKLRQAGTRVATRDQALSRSMRGNGNG
jgi:hypothetical protein